MIVEINESAKPEPQRKFPLLAKHADGRTYFIFTDEKKGLILNGDSAGRFSTYMTSVFDLTEWEVLPVGARIVLTQE